jgi:hypothetical protein
VNGLFELKKNARMSRFQPKSKESSPDADAIDSSKFIFQERRAAEEEGDRKC